MYSRGTVVTFWVGSSGPFHCPIREVYVMDKGKVVAGTTPPCDGWPEAENWLEIRSPGYSGVYYALNLWPGGWFHRTHEEVIEYPI